MDRSLELVRARIEANDNDFEAHRMYIDLLTGMGSLAAAQDYRARIDPAAPADGWALVVGPTTPGPPSTLSSRRSHCAPTTCGTDRQGRCLRATGRQITAIETYDHTPIRPTNAEA